MTTGRSRSTSLPVSESFIRVKSPRRARSPVVSPRRETRSARRGSRSAPYDAMIVARTFSRGERGVTLGRTGSPSLLLLPTSSPASSAVATLSFRPLPCSGGPPPAPLSATYDAVSRNEANRRHAPPSSAHCARWVEKNPPGNGPRHFLSLARYPAVTCAGLFRLFRSPQTQHSEGHGWFCRWHRCVERRIQRAGQRRDRTRALVECFPPVLASGRRWGARCWRRGMLQFPHTSLVCRSSFSRLRGACKGRFRPGRSRRWHGRSSRYVLGVPRCPRVSWPACPMAASSGSSFTRLFADSLICSRLSAFCRRQTG